MNEDLLVLIVMPVVIFVVIPLMGYVYYQLNKSRFYVVKYKLPNAKHPDYIQRMLVKGHDKDEAMEEFKANMNLKFKAQPYEVVEVFLWK